MRVAVTDGSGTRVLVAVPVAAAVLVLVPVAVDAAVPELDAVTLLLGELVCDDVSEEDGVLVWLLLLVPVSVTDALGVPVIVALELGVPVELADTDAVSLLVADTEPVAVVLADGVPVRDELVEPVTDAVIEGVAVPVLAAVPDADGVPVALPVSDGVPAAVGELEGVTVEDADVVSDAVGLEVCDGVRDELADAAGISARMGAGAMPRNTEPAGATATVVVLWATVS